MFLNESRREYVKYELNESTICSDPFDQFEKWYKFAQKNTVFEPNAMHLCTISPENSPNNRVVLLKSYNHVGFIFFSNYSSQKAKDIKYNNQVKLSFFWPNIEQQIHVTGTAHQVDPKLSDEYFDTRPRESQLSAWASNQSEITNDRTELEEKMKAYDQKFKGQVPRPPHWGGYIVKPTRYEFWQGRKNRFHDRIIYTKNNDNWLINRLNP